jgi:hypothetical protein
MHCSALQHIDEIRAGTSDDENLTGIAERKAVNNSRAIEAT